MTSRSASRSVSCHSRSSASNSRARSPVGDARSGGVDLDVVEPDDRIDREVADGEVLAHDLAMDLALGRDVDEDVAADRRPCTTGGGRRRGPSRLGTSSRARRTARDGPAADVMPCFANCADRRRHLAAAADARGRRRPSRCRRRASARHRAPSSRSANRPAPARRREDDERGRRPRDGRPRQPAGDGAAVDPAAADLALRHGFAVGGDPARRVRVVAHQHVGGHDRGLDLRLHRVRDRRGHARRRSPSAGTRR